MSIIDYFRSCVDIDIVINEEILEQWKFMPCIEEWDDLEGNFFVFFYKKKENKILDWFNEFHIFNWIKN